MRQVLDINIGEDLIVALSNENIIKIKLFDIKEFRDEIAQIIRKAKVKIEVNGEKRWIGVGQYNMPQLLGGIRIDCTVTRGYKERCKEDFWKLKKDARLRIWPKTGPLISSNVIVMPVIRDFFSAFTQMSNEPCFVNNATFLPEDNIYYHSGLDFGGVEGDPILAATDALVISCAGKVNDQYADMLDCLPRYDRIHLLDNRGWIYRYSHLSVIAPNISPGIKVKAGQILGQMGKEGTSGGWNHLHFEITALQPSGYYGTEDSYAYLIEDYMTRYKKLVLAVPGPHYTVLKGNKVTLDGLRSFSALGLPLTYIWHDDNGSKVEKPKLEKCYLKPGLYSEKLEVQDTQGNRDITFINVVVIENTKKESRPNMLDLAHSPRVVRVGQQTRFSIRSFLTTSGFDEINFGDGSLPLKIHSNNRTTQDSLDEYVVFFHIYSSPGNYTVSAVHTGHLGTKATKQIIVRVIK